MDSILIPSAIIGLGGWAKPVVAHLVYLFTRNFGFLPEVIRIKLFDTDSEGCSYESAEITPYLKVVDKKILQDICNQIRNGDKEILQKLEAYVDFNGIYPEGPGLGLYVQAGNLLWRIVWQEVVPDLKAVINVNPSPQVRTTLEKKGLKIANRANIWVIAGLASSTGASALIPFLVEISSLKAADTQVFVIGFTPTAYEEKSPEQIERGNLIFLGTMEILLKIFEEGKFNQPYDLNGEYQICLKGPLFDHFFLVDGSCGGTKPLNKRELASLVANALFVMITQVGEKALGILTNLNIGLRKEEDK